MEPQFLHRVPCTRARTPIVIPNWLRTYAFDWHTQGAAAVVLFGSRAHGLSLPDSDWDVAVIFIGHDALPSYNAVKLSPQVIRENEVNQMLKSLNDMSPTLIREVRSGIDLYGDVASLCKKFYKGDSVSIDRNEVTNHLANCYINLLRCIAVVNYQWNRQERRSEISDLYAHLSEQTSADAAERGVKTLCSALGIEYKYTHDIEELAKVVPDEWRDIVLSMNGGSKDRHVSGYGDVYYESCEESLDRVQITLDFIKSITDLQLFTPDQKEREKIQDLLGSESGLFSDHHTSSSERHKFCIRLFDQAQEQIRSITAAEPT